MRIALAQINPTIGDLAGNVRRVQAAAAVALSHRADLVVAPELAISGYPPKDLLLRSGFVADCDRAVSHLADALPRGVGVLVGHPTRLSDGRVANAASLITDGRIVATIHKRLLPNYDVFDEQRYFKPADAVVPIPLAGRRLGVHICEDAWWGEPNTFYHTTPATPDPIADLVAAGADVLINLSASPFEVTKPGRRLQIMRRHAARHARPVLFTNQVGGNDDLVFDGASFQLDSAGNLVELLSSFAEDLRIVDVDAAGSLAPPAISRPASILEAVTLGLHDYARKCGFSDCVLGLSGGIDSAVACCIAARALGPEHVHALLMPSRYSSRHSVTDSQQLAAALGIDHQIIPIDSIHRAYEHAAVVGDELAAQPTGLPSQNLQARIRGNLVMARSNHYGWLALATGNKSELAVGYCTLYGDMCGGFAVLSDLLKRDVYAVARHINDVMDGVIPENIIDKPPSAELAPDQRDQDTLPDYDTLDAILEALIEREQSPRELVGQFPAETLAWVVRAVDRNEYKRRQLPPGIKLSQRAFGSGRRMPMAARFEQFEPEGRS